MAQSLEVKTGGPVSRTS